MWFSCFQSTQRIIPPYIAINPQPFLSSRQLLIKKLTHIVNLSCSILTCLATVLIGAYAIYANGESHDTYFSSTSNAMQNPEIATLFRLNTTDGEPVGKKILKRRIKLVREGEVERFYLVGETKVVDYEKEPANRN